MIPEDLSNVSAPGEERHTPVLPGSAEATAGRRLSPKSPSVLLDGVRKAFGNFEAVRGLDLEIRQGEFFTMLGPSGCGKTTTLRMVAGFEEPTGGRVLIDRVDVADLPAHRRPTNTVFQSYALFPHLSVGENVAFGLRRKKVDKAEIERRVAAELERVGLAREINRRPNQLSGGMQQRVALARALVNLPKVLLLDEPLGALDLKLRKGLQVELKRIQRDVGITFIYVTHDQEEALTMSDRIAVMDRMPATVTSAAGGRGRVRLDAGVEVDAGVNGFSVGERTHAVVRPEKLTVTSLMGSDAADQARPYVNGIVESSVYLGTSTQMIVRLADDVRMTVLCPNGDDAERQSLPGAGVDVRLSWAPEHMHLVRGPSDGPAASAMEQHDNQTAEEATTR